MKMKSPPHPGELIQDNLADPGLSVAEAASGLGITHQPLHNVINGRGALSPEMALRLEQASGATRRLTGRKHPP